MSGFQHVDEDRDNAVRAVVLMEPLPGGDGDPAAFFGVGVQAAKMPRQFVVGCSPADGRRHGECPVVLGVIVGGDHGRAGGQRLRTVLPNTPSTN